jgi:hypothetical protein
MLSITPFIEHLKENYTNKKFTATEMFNLYTEFTSGDVLDRSSFNQLMLQHFHRSSTCKGNVWHIYTKETIQKKINQMKRLLEEYEKLL